MPLSLSDKLKAFEKAVKSPDLKEFWKVPGKLFWNKEFTFGPTNLGSEDP